MSISPGDTESHSAGVSRSGCGLPLRHVLLERNGDGIHPLVNRNRQLQTTHDSLHYVIYSAPDDQCMLLEALGSRLQIDNRQSAPCKAHSCLFSEVSV